LCDGAQPIDRASLRTRHAGLDAAHSADDRLYRLLDRLYPHRATIETALVQRERSLFNLDTTVYLYDLTSTYFEG
jgi:transposase